MAHYVISANRTLDGAVMYLAAENRWTTALHEALPADDKGALTAELAWARTCEALVCDPHFVKVAIGPVGPTALDAKQAIRAAGPDATLEALGFLRAASDAPRIHRAEPTAERTDHVSV